MGVVLLLVNVMAPVVAVVGLGWFAGRRLHFDIATLSRLAFWVIGPLFVLDVFADAELERETVWRLSVGGLAAMAIGAVLAYLIARPLRLPASRRSAAVMTSSYGNVGNAGLAICAFAFGEDAIPAAAVLMVAINGVGILLGVSLASAQTQGLGAAFRRALSTPMTLAAIAAIAFNALGVTFPLAIERTIGLVGGALIPIMLLTLGMQLSQDFSFDVGIDLGVVAALKLAVVPLAAAGIGIMLGLEGQTLGVLVIQSAMPPAVFTAVVALEFDLEPRRVTGIVLGATLLALFTIPVALVAVT